MCLLYRNLHLLALLTLFLFCQYSVLGQTQSCGFFSPASVTGTSIVPGSVKLADLNGDGNLDIVAVWGTSVPQMVWFRNLGNGTFANMQALMNFFYIQAYDLADMNGNGLIDIVFQTPSGIHIGTNNSSGTSANFTSQTISTIVPSAPLILADVNRNGYPDVVFSATEGSIAPINVLRYLPNNGNGNISSTSQLIWSQVGGNTITQVEAADLNGNGYLDFVMRRGVPGQAITIQYLLYNPSTAAYTFTSIPTSPFSPRGGLHLADINNNGRPEIIYSVLFNDFNAIIAFGIDNTTNELTGVAFFLANNPATYIQAIDVDADGWVDIGYTNTAGNFFMVKNPGTSEDGWTTVFTSLSNVPHFKLGDINSNNRPDLIVQNGVGNITRWENLFCANNIPPTAPSNVQYSFNSNNNTLTITWDPATDVNQPDSALTYQVSIDRLVPTYLPLKSTESNFAGIRRIVRSGRQGGKLEVTIANNIFFASGPYQSFRIGVQAIDNSYQGGPIAVFPECGNTSFPASDLVVPWPAQENFNCSGDIDDYWDAWGFENQIAPSNWSFSNTPSGNGTINTAQTPGQITITGSNNGSGNQTFTKYCYTPANYGMLSFTWLYNTNDFPSYWDMFGIEFGGELDLLTEAGSGGPQSQSISVFVQPSEPFCFVIWSLDNAAGASNVVISDVQFKQGIYVENECTNYFYTFYEDDVNFTACSTVYNRTYNIYTPYESLLSIDKAIVFAPTAGPVISGVPANANVNCASQVPPLPPSGTVTATGECDVSTNISFSQQIQNQVCPNQYQLLRTWTAIDACGNSSQATQIITVSDNQPPVFTFVPANFTVECNGFGNTGQFTNWAGQAQALDNCGTAEIEYTYTSTFSGNCTAIETRNVVFTATDACGNQSTATSQFIIQDNSAPEFTLPPNLNIPYTEDMSPENFGFPPAFNDICSEVTVSYADEVMPGSCSPLDDVILRTWTFTDECGNSSSGVQTITFELDGPITANLLGEDQGVCQGEIIVLDPGEASSYLWSDGSSNQTLPVTQTGMYSVTITTPQGCQISDTVQITFFSNPQPAIEGPESICDNEMATLNASSGFLSYAWSDGQTGQSMQVNSGGLYTVTVTDVNTCTGTASFNLIVFETPEPLEQSFQICEGQSVVVGNNMYTETGSYEDVLMAANGCDSVVITDVQVITEIYTTILDTICSGSTYMFGNTALTTTGNYTQTFESQAGCDSIVNLLLTVLPAYYTSVELEVCFGESVIFGGVEYNQPGIYTQSLITATGCDSIFHVTVSIVTTLAPEISVTKDTICQNVSSTLMLNDIYDSYAWSTGQTSPEITVTAGGNYTVTVTQGNCTGIAGFEITELICPPISAVFTLSDSLGCAPLSIQTAINNTNNIESILWNFGNGLYSNLPEADMVFGSPGIYEIWAYVSDGIQTDSFMQTVEVYAPPTLDFTFSTPDSCLPTQVEFEALYTGQFAAAEWFWQLNDGIISEDEFPVHLYPWYGTYLIALTVQDIYGCQAFTMNNIEIIDPGTVPPPTILNVDVCAGETFNNTVISQDTVFTEIFLALSGCDSLVITHVNALPAFQWVIDTMICPGEFVVIGNQLLDTPGIYIIEGINAAGCTDVYEVELLWADQPAKMIDTTICMGDTLIVNEISFYENNPSGSFIVSAQVGCDTLVNVQVQFASEELFLLPFNATDTAICENEDLVLNAGPGGISYQWESGETSSTIDISSGGHYRVTVSYADACPGIGEAFVYMQEIPVYIPIIQNDNLVCGTATTLQALTLPAGIIGQWNGPPDVFIANPFNPISDVFNLADGDNVFTWQVSTANGICRNFADDEITLIAYERSDFSQAALAGDDHLECVPETSVELSADGDFPSVDEGSWFLLEGPSNITFSSPNDPQATIQQIPEEGIYLLEWQLSNIACGIYSRDTLQIILGTPYFPPADGGNDFGSCGADRILLPVQLISGGSGQWNLVEGSAILQELESNWLITNAAGQGQLLEWVTSSPQCPDYDRDTIFVTTPDGLLTANFIQFILSNDEVFENIRPAENDLLPVYPGEWSVSVLNPPAIGTLFETGENTFSYIPPVGLNQTVTFSYKVCNTTCPDYCEVGVVALTPEALIPSVPDPPLARPNNVITPNGDEIGDEFSIPNFNEITGRIKLTIVNRWGDVMYSQYPYDNTWSGTANNGQPLQEGTYYYLIQLSAGDQSALDQESVIMGTVTILR